MSNESDKGKPGTEEEMRRRFREALERKRSRLGADGVDEHDDPARPGPTRTRPSSNPPSGGSPAERGR